jgi:hypothetical protein
MQQQQLAQQALYLKQQQQQQQQQYSNRGINSMYNNNNNGFRGSSSALFPSDSLPSSHVGAWNNNSNVGSQYRSNQFSSPHDTAYHPTSLNSNSIQTQFMQQRNAQQPYAAMKNNYNPTPTATSTYYGNTAQTGYRNEQTGMGNTFTTGGMLEQPSYTNNLIHDTEDEMYGQQPSQQHGVNTLQTGQSSFSSFQSSPPSSTYPVASHPSYPYQPQQQQQHREEEQQYGQINSTDSYHGQDQPYHSTYGQTETQPLNEHFPSYSSTAPQVVNDTEQEYTPNVVSTNVSDYSPEESVQLPNILPSSFSSFSSVPQISFQSHTPLPTQPRQPTEVVDSPINEPTEIDQPIHESSEQHGNGNETEQFNEQIQYDNQQYIEPSNGDETNLEPTTEENVDSNEDDSNVGVAWSPAVVTPPAPKSLLEIQAEELLAEQERERSSKEISYQTRGKIKSSAPIHASRNPSTTTITGSSLPRSAAWASGNTALNYGTSLTEIQNEQSTDVPFVSLLPSAHLNPNPNQSIKLITPIMPADTKTLRSNSNSAWNGKTQQNNNHHQNTIPNVYATSGLKPGPSSTPLLETPSTLTLKSNTGTNTWAQTRSNANSNSTSTTTNNNGIMSIRPKSMLTTERPTVRLLETNSTPTPTSTGTGTGTALLPTPGNVNPTRRTNTHNNKSTRTNTVSNESHRTNPNSTSTNGGSSSAFGGPVMSSDFSAWCVRELDSLTGNSSSYADLPQFLMTLDDSEVCQYIHEYLGSGPQIEQFAEQFLRYKQFETTKQHENENVTETNGQVTGTNAGQAAAAQAADAARARRRRKK